MSIANDERKKLLKTFATFDKLFQIKTLSIALSIPENTAEEILEKLVHQLNKEQVLAIFQKKEISTEKHLLILTKIKAVRQSRIRNKLLRFASEIIFLRQKGSGFGEISKYLRKAHRVQISKSSIYRVFRDIEKGKKEEHYER
ncbi:MAG: hypothetical protein N2745_01100 [Syntrophorhabdaceae bacterium]|nr:hypothetical protein [Syntrophorhabdaceae bacterium]